MATINMTVTEFNRACRQFLSHTGDSRHTQEQIHGAYRALALGYLGLKGTDEEIETAAFIFDVMTKEARARGWNLDG